MADIIDPLRNVRSTRPANPRRETGTRTATPRWEIIELLFFAYRDFVGDADAALAEFGFGRAHHRVLHFVRRYPGLRVSDLLEVLRITKQSLGRVLKQLMDDGYIAQRSGDDDRRQRLLFATPRGEALIAQLAALQTLRIDRALASFASKERETITKFLRGMIDRDEPDKVLDALLRQRNPDAGESQ